MPDDGSFLSTSVTAAASIDHSVLHDDIGDHDDADIKKTVTSRVVDAGITITDSTVNEVGKAHTFDITVTAFPGVVGPPVFNSIVASVSGSPTTQSSSCATPTINGNVATCTLTINSDTVGSFGANATAVVTINGVTMVRDTFPPTGAEVPCGPAWTPFYGPAKKKYVDANIKITADKTNEVGQPHIFNITMTALPGAATPVAFGSIVPSVTGAPTQSATCGTPTINDNVATCTFTINSATAGTFTANATGHVTIGGVALTRVTDDGLHGDVGPAVKKYVDASISIAPSPATNEVGSSHTFTVTVKKDLGDGAGLVPAPGVTVTSTLTNGDGATHTTPTGTCISGMTNASGQCTIVFNSPTDWPGGGFVGVHGTNEPYILPGAVSHGCIRMVNDAIVKLAKLMQVGTPLTVT